MIDFINNMLSNLVHLFKYYFIFALFIWGAHNKFGQKK